MGKARDYIPALKYGHKILPNDLAGMIGLPSVGEIFYVDAGSGSDTANSGTAANDAFKTVAHAKTKMTADQDDVLILAGTNSTGRTSEAAKIDWDLRRTHIIGNGPMRKMNPRNGIAFASGATTPLFTVSAKDCSFTNISIASFNDVNVLVEVTGDYNSFNYVHFQGIGNATTGQDTAARCLLLTAAEENQFTNCTIGLDTITRSAANASLELTGSCPRNQFINCDFPMYSDDAAALFVIADTGNCYERFLIFENCYFSNPDVNGSSTKLTIAMRLSTTGNGVIQLRNSYIHGATDWSDNFAALFSFGISAKPTATTAGIALVLA